MKRGVEHESCYACIQYSGGEVSATEPALQAERGGDAPCFASLFCDDDPGRA